MHNDGNPRSPRERASARELLALLAETHHVVAVPPRGAIVAALVALLRLAGAEDGARLSIAERAGTITIRFVTPTL